MRVIPALLLTALVIAPGSAGAVTITEGLVQRGVLGGAPNDVPFDIAGDGVHIVGTATDIARIFDRVNGDICHFCPFIPGGIFHPILTFDVGDVRLASNTITIGDATYHAPFDMFDFDFNAQFAFPETPSPTLLLSGIFLFNGFVKPSPETEGLSLVGQGVATAILDTADGCLTDGDCYVVRQVEYQFQPIPEPGTLLLLASGLAGLGTSAWRRRQRT